MKTKLLFLCTENTHRSPTARFLYENSEDYEVRSRGTNNDLEQDDIDWADLIIVMEEAHKSSVLLQFPDGYNKITNVLDIPDRYQRYDEYLIDVLKTKLEPWLGKIDVDADRLRDAKQDWFRKTVGNPDKWN